VRAGSDRRIQRDLIDQEVFRGSFEVRHVYRIGAVLRTAAATGPNDRR
jgi:hypothetical protein